MEPRGAWELMWWRVQKMSKISKRGKLILEKVDGEKTYEVVEAIDLLKKCSTVKFIESVDVSVNLGVDPKKSDQVVRSSCVLPHGSGRTVRVAVFAQDEFAEAAKTAGADKVGFEDLAEEIKAGKIEFDVLIAIPSAMKLVGQLGQILGPKGLMPNPKVGTVTQDVSNAVKNAKSGQIRFRNDKNGIIHGSIGKINFDTNAIKENLMALITEIKKVKPSTSKGIYLKKITLSTTMGPGLAVIGEW